ncbi:MAG: hypothetical protein ABSA02_25800 [Trebonia sp.]|jgi:hypothetical protein
MITTVERTTDIPVQARDHSRSGARSETAGPVNHAMITIARRRANAAIELNSLTGI